MFENESAVYALMLAYCKRLASDIAEEDMALRPGGGKANPPVWILGHLAVVTDLTLEALGKPPLCPPQWHAQFAPGSDPSAISEPLPTKAELLAALDRGHREVTAAAKSADPEAMARPHAVPLFRDSPLKTVGDFVALLMTAHTGVHLGQLSYWRRLRGLPHLF